MKVKICGITSLEDAAMCEELGADAVGFVHVPGRSRSIPLERVSEICSSLGPMTSKVLVCSPRDPAEAREMLLKAGTDIIQLHSLNPDETLQLKEAGARVVRAVLPERLAALQFASCADALLFEAGRPGSGAEYDYSKVPVDCAPRAIIAGGLTPLNMHKAKAMRPYALDVSTGVESAPGRKDPGLVAEFIRRCKE